MRVRVCECVSESVRACECISVSVLEVGNSKWTYFCAFSCAPVSVGVCVCVCVCVCGHGIWLPVIGGALMPSD